jgi:hypothetical protein
MEINEMEMIKIVMTFVKREDIMDRYHMKNSWSYSELEVIIYRM